MPPAAEPLRQYLIDLGATVVEIRSSADGDCAG
jgi:hypothetical protein